MSRWRHGLKRVGRVFHYMVRVEGKLYHGSTGESDPHAARKWLDTFLLELKGETPKGDKTLKEVLRLWVRNHEGVRSDSHVLTVQVMAKHLPLDLELREIGQSQVEEAVADYLRPGRSLGGASALLRTLRLLWKWGELRGMCKPRTWKVKEPKPQEKPRPVVPPAQIRAFLAAVDKESADQRVALRMMIGLGLREDEAITARWEWLDRELGTYRVGESKNRKARVVDVPPWLLAYLEPLAQDEGLVIPGHAHGFTRKAVRRAGEAVGIRGLTPHRMRHTFAVWQRMAGADPVLIQAMLGHEKLETTEIYLQVLGGEQRDAQRKAQELAGLGGVPPQPGPPRKSRHTLP